MMAGDALSSTYSFDPRTHEQLTRAMAAERLRWDEREAAYLVTGGQVLPLSQKAAPLSAKTCALLGRYFASSHARRTDTWLRVRLEDPFPACVAFKDADAGLISNLHRERFVSALAEGVLPRLATLDPLLPVEASSPTLSAVTRQLRHVAQTPIPVLITGETGTGKEVLARALHLASGRIGPYVAENCAALPDGLLEAELFGYHAGAFTGATRRHAGRLIEAHRGTLLLDEIGDLSEMLQAKLLRVLEERTVRPLGATQAEPFDARTISATHRDLGAMRRAGTFRSDLYFRLAGSIVMLPPLWRRSGDLPFLVATLLQKIRREKLGRGMRLSKDAMQLLTEYAFPGNVRELHNLLREAVALSAQPLIDARIIRRLLEPTQRVGNLEADAIYRAMTIAGGVKAVAARRLGWTRQKLYRRIAALEIDL